MLRSKIKYAVLGTIITSTLLAQPSFVKAASADKSITDPNKSWTIKFNQYVGFDDETKNAITVTDSEGNVVSTNIKLLDNNKIEVDAPEGGYKQGETYTLNIGSKAHSVGSRYIKDDAKYTFELSLASQDYNYKSQVENALNTTVDRILKDEIEDDWQALVVYRHGKEIPSSYLDSLKNTLNSKGIDSFDPTDYERMTIVLSSIGQDPTSFGGYNLVEKIYNNTNMDNQGVNAYIFGLIALDSGNFDVPDNALLNKDKLIDKIISSKTTDNGWSISDKADTDMTAMALTALAPYRNRQDVKQIVDNGIEKLSSMQDSDGGYSSMGVSNSQSLSQVIIALCSNGVDPAGSEFTKNGKNLMDLLLSYQVDGGFSFDRQTRYDSLSTEQAAEALEAYKLFKEQAIGIYVSK
ncbi:prenyltransferase/squalene oxidase repeat-containing protein [Clostridium sp. Mt-5]|uniref:Prenyltransferase/squalene oxidase repeat-containing protein n=1 Tax=Clostridium moutaii TaxID=3240932 RepID=A0ABV4BKZ7_9CLOT